MAEHVTPDRTAAGLPTARPRRRLTAPERKRSILAAARAAFSETGDANGTTIRVIAETAGISEGVIYRHFESKDELFHEAVVEPLRDAIDALVAATDVVDRDEPVTPARRRDAMTALYRDLTAALEEILPLLGLVLFGDPARAQRFYVEDLSPALDRLGAAWQAAAKRNGLHVDAPEVAVRAVTGMALLAALESRYDPGVDRERTLRVLSEGTLGGFFPTTTARTAGR